MSRNQMDTPAESQSPKRRLVCCSEQALESGAGLSDSAAQGVASRALASARTAVYCRRGGQKWELAAWLQTLHK